TCPNCRAKLQVRDEHAGKRGKCPKCGSALDVPAKTPAAPVNAFDEALAPSTARKPAPMPPPIPAHHAQPIAPGFTAPPAPEPVSVAGGPVVDVDIDVPVRRRSAKRRPAAQPNWTWLAVGCVTLVSMAAGLFYVMHAVPAS